MRLAIDWFGRIVLPKVVRDDLGLAPGDLLDVDVGAQGVTLRPVRDRVPVHQKNGLLVFAGNAFGDIRAAVADSRASRACRRKGRGREALDPEPAGLPTRVACRR